MSPATSNVTRSQANRHYYSLNRPVVPQSEESIQNPQDLVTLSMDDARKVTKSARTVSATNLLMGTLAFTVGVLGSVGTGGLAPAIFGGIGLAAAARSTRGITDFALDMDQRIAESKGDRVFLSSQQLDEARGYL